MFEAITDNSDRGQVGIGTLIVFIAMVLVAAIAAGVLINTAGSLQSQASDTGSETQDAVANQIEVTHAAGHVGDESGDIEDVNMILMQSAGSNEIDLTSMTAQFTSSQADTTLTHGDVSNSATFETSSVAGENDGDSLITSDDRIQLSLNTDAIELAAASDVETVDGTAGDIAADVEHNEDFHPDDNAAFDVTVTNEDEDDPADVEVSLNYDESEVDSGEIVTVGAEESETVTLMHNDLEDHEGEGYTIDIDGGDLTIDTNINVVEGTTGLETGSSATVALVDQSGAQYTYGISVPSTFGDAEVVEV